MKIGIDIRTAGGEKTGKGWYTFYMVQNLLRLDRENEYVLYTKNKIAGFDNFKNVKIKQIKSKGIFWHIKTARDAKKENIDIFFAPSSYILPAIIHKKIKTIITVHDLVAFLFPENHNKKAVIIEKIFLKRALKKASFVLTVSKNTKKDILEKFKIDSHKIGVAYCSADEIFKPMEKTSLISFAKETNLPAKFFLAVGTICPRKNYKNLIMAFAQFSEKFPDYNLIIVGNKGWKYEEVEQIIRKNYLNKKVHILGYISEKNLIKLYNLAKAFVFPSYYEGFGIPPLEAMKCGCPVIASYTSSIPEVVGDAALFIDPQSSLEIAGAMIKTVKDEELREKLSNRGLIQSKKFSWKTSAEKLLEAISNV